MSGTNLSAAAAYSPAQPQLPTPSPYSYSVASTRWTSSTTPPFQKVNLILRFLALVLSCGSALSLAALSPSKAMFKEHSTKFNDYPELVYCFTVNIFAFLYAAYQLFKSVCDIAQRGIFISDKVSDYISFIVDQLAGYLLVSASSVAAATIQRMNNENPLWKPAIVSVCMSFSLSIVIGACALMSGHKICKRIIW